ncbi:MAG: DUF4286 family protein [Ignavibacteriales bacterium]|jgi:hypothetical protein|nr:MAG: DUF4286 family protein [Ignavibacteriaceae bacterium]MBW7871854.1 DUF4286 family protein [Ignavibacteria bacterium]MCZ2144296.1 DUF4286 family protein [Ignavibacteriales bacterium]MBV6446249.1 hypothetical protein [Ignavibacteriaceae bacterium]MBZ0197301.1 DUF4286 family protein [Ignavibacteriaceae bacterium]
MIYYYVKISVESKIQTEWVLWMMETHIPRVEATGRFKNCYFQQIIDPQPTPDKVDYLTVYECDSLENLRNYREKDAPQLMQEHAEKFGGSFEVQRFVGAPLKMPEGKIHI